MRPIGLVYAFVALAGLQSVAHLTPAATEFRVIEVPGSSETIASAINAQGDVVGRYTGNDKRVHGFLLSGSRYTSIDVPHAEFTMVRGINDAGDLVGRATIKGQWVAFVMKKGDIRGITLLSYPGAWRTQGFQINSKGDVVGSWQPEGGGSRGFLYAGDKWISLEHPNATTSYATGINDAGEVVGTWDSAGGREHGYTWRDGTFASFDVPGASGTLPDAINSRGHIVGRSVMADGRVLGFYKT